MAKHKISLSFDTGVAGLNRALYKKFALNSLKYILNDQNIIDISELKDYMDFCLNLDILICNDEKIKQLNNEFRDKNEPTDVLSFALFADNPDLRPIIDNNIFLGEIIISVETAQKQADAANKSLNEEICFLISHGILHLFGFTHDEEKSYNFMIETQNSMLTAGCI